MIPEPKTNLQYLWNLFCSSHPTCHLFDLSFYWGVFGRAASSCPISLCVLSHLQDRRGKQTEIKKSTHVLLAKLGQSMWLRSKAGISLPSPCPPSLYMQTSWSQNEVCRAQVHPADHRDVEGMKMVSTLIFPLLPLPPHRGGACSDWLDTRVLTPIMQIPKQNPK